MRIFLWIADAYCALEATLYIIFKIFVRLLHFELLFILFIPNNLLMLQLFRIIKFSIRIKFLHLSWVLFNTFIAVAEQRCV